MNLEWWSWKKQHRMLFVAGVFWMVWWVHTWSVPLAALIGAMFVDDVLERLQ